jgi:hypothetical protein
LIFFAAGLAHEVDMSSQYESRSGWGGCIAFTAVLAVAGVIGYVVHGQAASKPPLAVTVRHAMVGNGKVLRITNTSNEPIHQVRLSLANRQDHYERVIADTIQPHDTIEFAWQESGFALEKGMRIELRASGYDGSFRDTIL